MRDNDAVRCGPRQPTPVVYSLRAQAADIDGGRHDTHHRITSDDGTVTTDDGCDSHERRGTIRDGSDLAVVQCSESFDLLQRRRGGRRRQ